MVKPVERISLKGEKQRDNPSDFVGLLTTDGIIMAVNSSALSFIGAEVTDVIGKPFWDTPWWRHSEEMQQRLKEAINDVITDGYVEFEATHLDQYGQPFILNFSLNAVMNSVGEVVYLVPQGRDVTALKTLEDDFRETEASYKKIFQAISDIIFIADQNGIIIEANESACTTYGYSKEEFRGMPATQIVHSESHDVLERFLREAAETDRFAGQTKEVRKDGSTFYADVKGSRIQYHGMQCLLAILRDISVQKKMEEALREREQLYLSLFQNNSSAIMLVDSGTQRIFDANPAACSYYGHSRKEIIKMKLSDITVSSEADNGGIVQADPQTCISYRHRLADGTINDVEVFSGPIAVAGRSFLCLIIHDVSARKQMEREREELIANLQTALNEIKTLQGILPICAKCKKIRDDTGYWNQLEMYLDLHTEASFSHGICPDCYHEEIQKLERYQRKLENGRE